MKACTAITRRLTFLIPAIVLSAFAAAGRPNIIIIFTDDQAYGDVGVYGSPNLSTPRLDRLAAEGLRFTDFYVTTSVCSASRASLLTGRYPDLNGTPGVYFPGARGLDPNETTLAEMLRDSGYATALIGKWHLGDLPGSLPTHHGFDRYWGVPYSNDMYIGPTMRFAPDVVLREGYDLGCAQADRDFVKNHVQDRGAIRDHGIRDLVPILRDEEIVEYPADQATLTRRTFDEAIRFIDDSTADADPFFLFITPSMPHIPLFASAEFEDTSRGGLFGDTIEEIDFNIGRLLDHLDASDLSEETLVIFTTDNGPWLSMGDHAGTAGPFRDGKFSSYEGGLRVPAIMRWPGKIPVGKVSHELASTIDLLPTVAAIIGAKLPEDKQDGVDLSHHLRDPAVGIDREAYFYYRNGKPVAVRQGYWKYFPHGGGRRSTESDPAELYHLATDLSEARSLAAKEPERVAQMQALIDRQLARASDEFSLRTTDFRVRDPFIIADKKSGLYHLYVQTGNRLINPDTNLGVEVYRSPDLQNWSEPTLAFQRPENFWGGQAIWAPEVHHLGEHYYMFVTFQDVSEKRGGYRGSHILRADSPTGPFIAFSPDATTPPPQRALDATPFVDEEGRNWMIYCHEWAQVVDGGMLLVEMAADWSHRIGEPTVLFTASEGPWVRPFSSPRWMDGKPGFVTDGPAFHRLKSGSLLMLWSSFGDNGYAVGIAESKSGLINGPWIQRAKPLFAENGGHTMLFRDFEGQLLIALHQPNSNGKERAHFFRVIEENETLRLEPR